MVAQPNINANKGEDLGMKTTSENNPHLDHEEIANLAKQIWEREGRPAGRDLECWLRAERQALSSKNPASNLPRKLPVTGTAQSQGASRAIRLPDSTPKPAHAR